MLQESQNAVTFNVRVIPRTKRNEIVGIENNAVKIRLTAPPVEGRANEALLKFLAHALGVARANVEIVRGESSRHKVVRVRGMTAARVNEILNKKA